jgi:hypothetical protein
MNPNSSLNYFNFPDTDQNNNKKAVNNKERNDVLN